ncbi:hypothetical protein BVX98_07475 [bacterium F11]|nr:hypothetical protein BVX98_07475 [bacterium F11]
MKRTVVVAGMTILFCLGVVSFPSYAKEMKNDPQGRKDASNSVKKQKDKLTKLKIDVHKDVNNGLSKVRGAIKTLDEGKVEETLNFLKEAVGSFDIALAADPDLNLVPVSSVVKLQELYTDVDTVQRQVSIAEGLLKSGKVQAARGILLPLKSDVTETVTYLPMSTYPDAIRAAVKQIVNENIGLAKETLAVAMSTLVVSDVKVVPIPIVTARALIDEASKLDKEKKKDEIKGKLDRAKEQLELARVLGYQTKSSKTYKKIKKDIEKIEKEIEGENKVEKLYTALGTYFNAWVDRIALPFFPEGVTKAKEAK